MPDERCFEVSAADAVQPLLERISQLEEEIRNLVRLRSAIERNNGLFEALLASSRDGIALTRLDGTIIRVVRPIMGYARDLSGTSIYDLVCAEDQEAVCAAYRRLREGRQLQTEIEFHMWQPDGSVAWIECTITDMLDNPAVHAIVLNYCNVTQFKTGQLARAEYAATLRFAPFAVFSQNTTGEVLSWNHRAQDLFGYEEGEILSRPVSALAPPERWEEELKHCSYVIEGGTATARFRTTGVHKDGTQFPMEMQLSPIIVKSCVRAIARFSYPLISCRRDAGS